MTDSSDSLMLPEGFTLEEVSDLDRLAQSNPQRCMMFIDETLKHTVSAMRQKWIAQARMLYFVKKENLWQYHPAGFSSFFEWCAQPEIDIPGSIASDMLAIAKFQPDVLEHCGIDIFEVIEQIGQANVRSLVPSIRRAYRNGTLNEEITELLSSAQGSSYRDILKMVTPIGKRLGWDPEVVYEEVEHNGEGRYNMTFRNLSFDEMELLTGKAGVKRWYDIKGRRIEPPVNALLPGDTDAFSS